MADGQAALEALRRADATPLAQLCPDMQDASSRVVDGVVTITWPYSVVAETTAFILAEHDCRLRRDGGQLRVELRGAAARALGASAIGGGDEIRLSLRGAEWERHPAPTRLPAGTLEWQVKFSNRLLLQLRRAQGQGCETIQVDGPDARDAAPEPDGPLLRNASPPPLEASDCARPVAASDAVSTPSSLPAKRHAASAFAPDEYASPAFLKRARVSYGSLFDDGLDILDEEKGTRAKNKCRSRFSMGRASWRYTSRSPTPEANEPSDRESDVENGPRKEQETQAPTSSFKNSPLRPPMVDEACQTLELYASPSHMEVQVSAESRLARPMLPPAPSPGAQHSDASLGFQTPSRSLFDRRPGQQGMGDTADVPDAPYQPVDPHAHDFGLGAVQHTGSATMLGAPPVAASAMSTGAFVHDVSAPCYPFEAFGNNPLHLGALDIDPGLQLPDAVPVPDSMYFDAPPPGQAEWHAEAVAPGQPWAPAQDGARQPTAVADRSWPVGRHPHSNGSESSHSNASAPGRGTDSGRAEGALESEASREAGGEEIAGSDDVDGDAEDIPGEDYDLRNYDRARDDDEEESEEESEPDGSDVDQQAIELSEDEADEDRHPVPDTNPYDEARYGEEPEEGMRRGPGADEATGYPNSDDVGSDEEDEAMDNDQEAGYYDQEDGEGYDEHSEDDEEEEEEEEEEVSARVFQAAPRAAPREPVFINLLSDSEDEQEPQAATGTPNPSLPAEYSIPPDGPAGSGPAEAADDAEAHPDDGSLINFGQDADHAEPPAPGADGHAQQRLEPEPMSQPARLAEPDAVARDHEATSEVTVVREEPEADGNRPVEGSGQHQHQDAHVHGEDPTANNAVPAVAPEPMDVDEAPARGVPADEADEAPSHEAQVAETVVDGASSHEARATESQADEPPRIEASVDEKETDEATTNKTHPGKVLQIEADKGPADGGAVETLPSYQEAAVELFESRPSQATELDEQVLAEASDSLLEDAPQGGLPGHGEPVLHAGGIEIDNVGGESHASNTRPGSSDALDDAQAAGPPREDVQQLPTPSGTQLRDAAAAMGEAEKQAVQENEHALAAQAQIMTEHEESLIPNKPVAAQASQSRAPDEQVEGDHEEQEALITVKSLRSRAHRRTRSGDASSELGQDPSVVLVRASATRPSTKPGSEAKSPPRLRVAGARAGAADPSLVLAKKAGGKRQSPARSRAASGVGDDAAAMPSRSPKGKRRHATPETTRELRSRPVDAGRGTTPDTGAGEAILKSPSVAKSVEDEDAAARKRNLQKALRALPDFAPLRSLRSLLNKTVDMAAMATTTPAQPHRPKHGPRDYMLELILSDASTAPTSVVVAHLFRPHQASLPVVQGGDVVLLRRVQVVSVKGRGFGARAGEASSWAVFEKDNEEMLPQIKGPPVELTDGEVEYARGLKRWWAAQGEAALAKVDRAARKASQAAKGDAK